jgi:hypothetical protein
LSIYGETLDFCSEDLLGDDDCIIDLKNIRHLQILCNNPFLSDHQEAAEIEFEKMLRVLNKFRKLLWAFQTSKNLT